MAIDTPVRIIATRPGPRSNRGTSDFSELARDIRASGLMRRRYGYYWTKILAVPVVFAAAITGFVLLGDTWWQLAVAVVFAVLFTQTAMLGHDAAHRQIFKSGKWNDWISLIVGDLFVGMSYGWWQHKHTRHHANPNKEGLDPDLELPVVSFTPDQAIRRRNPVTGWAIAHQGAFFFPILLFEGLSLHASSVRRVFQREHIDRRWVEMAFMAVRFGGYLTLVFLVLSPGIAFAFLGVQLGLFGFYMGASFAPNHKGMPLVPEGCDAGLPAPAGDDEPQHPREVGCWTSRWAGSTTRSSTTCSRRCRGRTFDGRRRSSPPTAVSMTFRTPRPDCSSRTGSCCATSTGSDSASGTRSIAR